MVLNQLRSESLFTGEFVWARKESSHQRRIHAKAVEKSPPTPRASQLLSHHCDDEKRQVVVPFRRCVSHLLNIATELCGLISINVRIEININININIKLASPQPRFPKNIS